MKKLSREDLKNVVGGIPIGYGFSTCLVNGKRVQQLVSCSPCPHCNSGSFISTTCSNHC